MVGSRQALVTTTARKKGWKAALAAGGSVAIFSTVGWVLGCLSLAGSAWLTYDWLKFRGKNGLRF